MNHLDKTCSRGKAYPSPLKRLAIIATNEFDAFAGSELLWSEAAERLANDGSEVFVNAPRWPAEPDRISRLRRHERVRFVVRPSAMSMARCVLAKAGLVGVESFFGRYRREYLLTTRPDLVVISQGGLVDGVGWMEACVDTGVPFVAIVHLVADTLWPASDQAARAAAAYPRARRVYFVSEENRASAGRQLGATFTNSAIARNPFNVAYGTPPEWPAETGEWKLACVGRLGAEHKGQDLLIEVLSGPKWRNRPLSVTLFGQGHHQAYLERLIALRGCDQVKVGGYTNGITEVWRGHHAMVMPSRYEGLPIALVEAMLCHRMAIVTDVGGNAELVEEALTGFVAAAPNVASVDAALERAWQQRDRWHAMGLAAGQRVRATVPADPVGAFIMNLDSVHP
jgi:glycosyltransferase involved in cell wall biosynthesis